MTEEQFINLLYSAGWTAQNDAQHEGIGRIFKQLFPMEAKIEQLEQKIFDLEDDGGRQAN